MTVTTVYSEAHGAGGATTTDGGVAHQTGGSAATWATLVAGAGTTPPAAVDQEATNFTLSGWDEHGSTSNRWTALERGIVLFTDPGIDAGDVITAATLSGYGKYKGTAAGDPTIKVYSSNPASNTAIVAGDFDSLGSTSFTDTTLLGSNLDLSDFNDWVLNANGLANINKNAISKFGFRDATYDVADSAPAWQGGAPDMNIRIWSADEDQTGDRRPKLVITHSAAFTPRAIMF